MGQKFSNTIPDSTVNNRFGSKKISLNDNEPVNNTVITPDSAENLSADSGASNFKWLEGRPFIDLKGSQFVFPLDGEEADRLNLVFLRSKTAALTIFFAPIKSTLSKPGAKVLDVGCGTGIWIKEMAEIFPNASFTGLDVTGEYITKTILPNNCTFLQHNALEGLPFSNDDFDYIHQSDMAITWTKEQWKLIISEMIRVLKPGCYIELWEIDCQVHRQGPASHLINDPIIFALQARGLDPFIARRVQALLAGQNIRKIQTKFFSLPFAWGGPIGELSESSLISAVRNLKPWLANSINVDSETFDNMMEDSIANLYEYKSYLNQHIAWGMKSRKQPSMDAKDIGALQQ